jgi:hypothetical protein
MEVKADHKEEWASAVKTPSVFEAADSRCK